MKVIGLIGGLSWESTAHYYTAINRETAQRRGGLHSAPMLIESVDFAPIAEMQTRGAWDEAGDVLAKSAARLGDSGAEVLAIASNTMHIAADQVAAASTATFVHIADPTAAALAEDGVETVGLLGTRFTLEMPFYRDRLAAAGLNVLVPEVDVTNLNGIIFEELCRGIVRDPSRQTYVAAISRLAAAGAEAVILGCTELNMLIDDDVSPLPVYDTTALHAKALVDLALAS